MRVLLTGGGTAGHINPALAIGGYIKEHCLGSDVRYIGCASGMEARIVPQAGYKFYPVEVRGFDRRHLFKNVETMRLLKKAVSDAKAVMKDFKPDVVIGVGGYVSYPAIYAAAKMGITAVIHEQNAYPGISNKMSAKYADKIMLTVEDSIKYLKKYVDKCVVTGLPIRSEVVLAKKNEERQKLGFDEKPLILSVGGSLGAHEFNKAVCEMLPKSKYNHVHVTGSKGYTWVPDKLREAGVKFGEKENIRVYEYVDMSKYLPACDIIISRCGASTLSEIEALGKPSILIPSPNVTENHQYHNGMALVNKGAAIMIEEKDLTPQKLLIELENLAENKDRLKKMSAAAADMAIYDAAKRMYDVITEAVNKAK